MMGYQPDFQPKHVYKNINIEKRVRRNHILRKICKHIDFNFIYNEVKDKYGSKGNVSVPPPIILKMMLLIILYSVRSERELMATIPERLDWLWFLGYDLDDEIPNHSVLSKARARWGVDAFRTFFDRIVRQCVEAGLVDGTKMFADSSLVQADASNNSVVNKESLKRYLNKRYRELEACLDTQDCSSGSDHTKPNRDTANRKYISTTDPDSSVVRHSKGKARLRYKVHRGVDGKNEIITATEVTPGDVNEAHRLRSLIDTHEKTTGQRVETAVADSKYGTTDNYLVCHDRRIRAHFNSVEETQRGSGRQKDIFPKETFSYDPENDTFICPAGHILKRRNYRKNREQYEYKASARTCSNCQLREKCTRAKDGRTLKRHARQNELDIMLKVAHTREAKKDIKTRQHLMERSFGRATRYGFKRARWRRLWRAQIQEYLTATIQNLMVLVEYTKKPAPALGMIPDQVSKTGALLSSQSLFPCFRVTILKTPHLFLFPYLLMKQKLNHKFSGWLVRNSVWATAR